MALVSSTPTPAENENFVTQAIKGFLASLDEYL
jgi:hypothetical protein